MATLKNSTGWALLKQRVVKTTLLHADSEILQIIADADPRLVAIDAPLSLPQTGNVRTADIHMINRGYRVFPLLFSAMKELTSRAIRLNALIAEKGYKPIEVHPTSTRKALKTPTRARKETQATLKYMGLKGDIDVPMLSAHEIDAVTAVLPVYLYLRGKTESVGNKEDGCIIVPKIQGWRTLRI